MITTGTSIGNDSRRPAESTLRKAQRIGMPSRLSAVCGLLLASQLLTAGGAAAQDENPDARAVAEYRLTDERVESFVQASRNLAAVHKANPDISLAPAEEGASIAETAARFDAVPAIREAIESAGMSSEEYLTFTFAMFQAGMAAWMVEEYGEEKRPADVPRENVDYYLANKARFEALTAELKQLKGEGG